MASVTAGAGFALDMNSLDISAILDRYDSRSASSDGTAIRYWKDDPNNPEDHLTDYTILKGSSFAFNLTGPTKGVIDTIRVVSEGEVELKFEKLSMPLKTFYNYVNMVDNQGTATDEGTQAFLNDALKGNDVITGSNIDDVLHGYAGADTLVGGLGKDDLWGDAGADIFDFNAVAESTVGAGHDTVHFEAGVDKVDLRTIDANGVAEEGNQSFRLVSEFSGTSGQAILSNGLFQADLTGDGAADFEIALDVVNGVALSATDFLL
jgi:Ca2+-binding RTX toxin-like protein